MQRVKAVFRSRANGALNSLEDPKASLDYSMVRLEDHLRQASQSLVEIVSAQRRLQSQRDALAATAGRHTEQARAALEHGREDLARLALERRQAALGRHAELEETIAGMERQVDDLKATLISLHTRIELYRVKKEELKAIYDSSRARLRVREALTGMSADLADVGSTIRRAEERIQEMQARTEAIDGLVATGALEEALAPAGDDIDAELARLRQATTVEDELLELKRAALTGRPQAALEERSQALSGDSGDRSA